MRARYGKATAFLQALRLVEAGVSVVTACFTTGGWDTHRTNFSTLRQMVPPLDQALHALVTDLAGLGDDAFGKNAAESLAAKLPTEVQALHFAGVG